MKLVKGKHEVLTATTFASLQVCAWLKKKGGGEARQRQRYFNVDKISNPLPYRYHYYYYYVVAIMLLLLLLCCCCCLIAGITKDPAEGPKKCPQLEAAIRSCFLWSWGPTRATRKMPSCIPSPELQEAAHRKRNQRGALCSSSWEVTVMTTSLGTETLGL